MKVHLSKEFFIEAAHRNEGGRGPASRLHGHSFKIEVCLAGEINTPEGWLLDFGDIKKVCAPLLEKLDHSNLNEFPGLDDTSLDGLSKFLLERFAPELPSLQSVRVSVLGDNAFRPVQLAPEPHNNLPERLRFSFEAAQSLPQLPSDHHCHNMHGHSYRIEVGSGDLDSLEPSLRKLYDMLDHRCLNDIEGLNTATCELLCEWIWDRLLEDVEDLAVVVVQETSTARCMYYGE